MGTNNVTERLKTGIEGLDNILGGGLTRNRLYLIMGSPGTGKTTMALQFLLEGLRKGEPGLYVTLSETKEELEAVAQSHGWSLDGINICDLTVSEESLRAGNHYTLFHPSELELDETTQRVLDEVERVQPLRVVFDSLSEMRLLAHEALRYRRQILALKQFFIGRQCTVLLLDDHTSQEPDQSVESLVHGVILLENIASHYGTQRHRLRVMKLRGIKFRSGYHDFNIETGGIVVFPRLIIDSQHFAFASTSLLSGVRELDQQLGGGLPYGTSTLIIGPAGVGKSTLAVQYAFAAAQRGERAALFIFDEGPATLLARCSTLGIDLSKHMDAGRITVRQVDPAVLSPGEFFHLVRQSVQRDKARVIIIDSLNGYLNAMPEERFLTIQMHELLSYLNQQGIISLLVMGQYGLFGAAMNSPIDVSYLADTVILMRYFEAAGKVSKAISVIKKRSGRHEQTLREFQIGAKGLALGKPLTQFRGILTGVPRYEGEREFLIGEDDESL